MSLVTKKETGLADGNKNVKSDYTDLFTNFKIQNNDIRDKLEAQFVTLYDINGNPSHVEVVITPEKMVRAGGDIKTESGGEKNQATNSLPPKSSQNTNSRHVRTDNLSWLRYFYPELATIWQTTSGSQFYQGGVDLLCSLCKLNTASGFHEGRPICEDEIKSENLMCTVCRIRKISGIHEGLAICDDDKNFLDFTFSHRLALSECYDSCPPQLDNWCRYCRLRACILTPGLKLTSGKSCDFSQSNSGQLTKSKKKLYLPTVVKELNFSLPPGVSPKRGKSEKEPVTTLSQGRAYYDGRQLGLGQVPSKWSGEMRQDHWARQQQIKYFNYHIALYRKRNGPY